MTIHTAKVLPMVSALELERAAYEIKLGYSYDFSRCDSTLEIILLEQVQ